VRDSIKKIEELKSKLTTNYNERKNDKSNLINIWTSSDVNKEEVSLKQEIYESKVKQQ